MHRPQSTSSSIDFLTRGRREDAPPLVDEPQDDQYDGQDYKPFGLLRRPTGGLHMINFISRQGRQRAFPYAHLDDVEFEGGVLVLRFSEHVVTIQGHGIGECHRHLLAHRVVFIAEADHAVQRLAPNNTAVVTLLAIEARTQPPYDFNS